PTGVAAINAGGVTLHSLFGLPLVSFIPENDFGIDRNIAITKSELHQHFRYNKEKRKLLTELDMLIIDEVSMLRADILDAINFALQNVRRNLAPFGGVQVVMIGDMYQLPPVIKDEQWNLLKNYYKSLFFFDARILQDNQPACIEFKQVYRQEDPVFINLLNAIRFQDFDLIDFELLHQRYHPNFEPEESGYITLTTHNYIANEINQKELEKLSSPICFFEAVVDGSFSENAFPTDFELVLKEGAQVMFIRNDTSGERRYFNGKIGIVEKIENDDIFIRFENQQDLLKLEHEVWKNIKYTFDSRSGKISEEELGSFSQYPIRLAWAVTIHKSQGLTFDKAIVDAGKSFASGQVYVALSRCRTLEGIVLKSMIHPRNIIQNEEINAFQSQMWNVHRLESMLDSEKYSYALQTLFKTLDMKSLKFDLGEWRKTVLEKSIPEKEIVLDLISSVNEMLDSFQAVNRKFENTILKWYQSGNNEELWQKISKKSSDAVEYFAEQLFQKVWKPVAQHFIEYKKKAKIKQYLSLISEFEESIKLKIKNILSAHLIDERLTYKESVFTTDDGEVKVIDDKEDTIEITLQFLCEGKTLEQTANERCLAISTISNHVSKLIAKGKISVYDFLSEEKYNLIRQKILELNSKEIKPIKNALGDEISYDDIKFVRSDMGR
ncbi:MAG: helix-turn-helix domain-containing protein, partial [Flavobacteriaceae bacterium]|nr:helix-turn-helix domain-containing protein [Flavobacteriaceae bacterium]